MKINSILEQIPPYPLDDDDYGKWQGKREDMPERLKQLERGYDMYSQHVMDAMLKNAGESPSSENLQFGTILVKKDLKEKMIKKYGTLWNYGYPDDEMYIVLAVDCREESPRGKYASTGNGYSATDSKKECRVLVSYLNHKFQDWKALSELKDYVIYGLHI